MAPRVLALGLKPEFGYICLAAAGSFILHNVYMAMKVGAARRKYGVPYPAMYADASHTQAKKFNCVQRAHQNSLENLPTFLSLLVLGGLQYPATTAVGALIYLVGRLLYFEGYATGDPDKRFRGSVGYIGLFTMLGCVVKMGYDLLQTL